MKLKIAHYSLQNDEIKRREDTSRRFWTDLSLLAETNGMKT